MGAWGLGPFDSDAAGDFLAELREEESPGRAVRAALKAAATAPDSSFLEVDEGAAAWAAAEVVAAARGAPARDAPDDVLEPAARLKATPALCEQAVQALLRLTRGGSELLALFAEGGHRSELEKQLEGLRQRLTKPPERRARPTRATKGDVLAIPVGGGRFAFAQVTGPGELALFAGAGAAEDAARLVRSAAPAVRLPCNLAHVTRTWPVTTKVKVREDLASPLLYAIETDPFSRYSLLNASVSLGSFREAEYEEARRYPLHAPATPAHLLAMAREAAEGRLPPLQTVRSPEEREREFRALHRHAWPERRARTSPAPFGDPERFSTDLLPWLEEYGTANAIRVYDDVVHGRSGHGRPDAGQDQRAYDFAACVGVWCGALPRSALPGELASRLPEPPAGKLPLAVATALRLLEQLLDAASELRMVWEEAEDGGEAFRREVQALRAGLQLAARRLAAPG